MSQFFGERAVPRSSVEAESPPTGVFDLLETGHHAERILAVTLAPGLANAGRVWEAALKLGLKAFCRNAGEYSISGWLRERVKHSERTTVVVYENGKILRFIGDVDVATNVDNMTRSALPELAEKHHLIPSAGSVWNRIVSASPIVNPEILVTMKRGPACQKRIYGPHRRPFITLLSAHHCCGTDLVSLPRLTQHRVGG